MEQRPRGAIKEPVQWSRAGGSASIDVAANALRRVVVGRRAGRQRAIQGAKSGVSLALLSNG